MTGLIDAHMHWGEMMLERRVVLVASALVALSVSLYAQAPATIGQIPVYAGAVRDIAHEAEIREESAALWTDAIMRHLEIRAWRIKAPAEAVAAYYRQRLAALDRSDDAAQRAYEDGVERLRPGKTTPVMLDLGFVNFGGRVGENHDFRMTADKLRAAYARVRSPFAPNQWIETAGFEWNGMDAAKQQFHYTVSVEEFGGVGNGERVPAETRVEFVGGTLPDM
jgi:hypothetical protein